MTHRQRVTGSLSAVLSLLAFLLFSQSLVRGQAPPSPFTNIVVFGDSLSDTGNVAHVTNATLGVRYPGPLFNYTDGRFTDGLDTTPSVPATPHTPLLGVWHEQFAQIFTGLAVAKNSLDGGSNYAYGAATTQDGTSTISYDGAMINVENMGMQVTDYLTRPGGSVDPNALYVVWGGADDLFTDASPANLVAAPARLAALTNRLAQAGAVNILVPNLPPLGSTPDYAGQPVVIAELNAASAYYDAQLKADLDALQLQLATAGLHVRIYQLDIYTLFQNLVANPASYGLTDIVDSAQGLASVNPDTYLFWDDVHPTTAGHYDIAAAARSLMIPAVALTVTPTTSSTPGEQVTFSAVVTSQAPAPAPTGTVTFYDNSTTPATQLGAGAVDDTGTATFTTSTLGAGTYEVVAVYGGDASNLTSTSQTVTYKVAAPSTTTLALSTAQAAAGASVTLTATVAGSSGVPTGTVNFLDGTAVLGSGNLNSSGVATYTSTAFAVGAHALSAIYTADNKYSGSTSATQTLTIVASGTTTTLTSSLNPAGAGQTVVFTAVVAAGAGIPTGTVTFLQGTTSLGTRMLDSTGTATLSLTTLAVGADSITASYGGDANYLGSVSAALTETIVTPSISFTVTPSSLTIPRGGAGGVTITGTPVGGFSGTAGFACANLPVDASCTFAQSSLVFSGPNAPQTTQLTISTKLAPTAASREQDIRGSGRVGVLALLFMPWVGFAAALRRKKPGRRGAGMMLGLAICALIGAAGLTACGSSSNETPPGTYQVQVTISGVGTVPALTIPVTVQ